MRSFTVEIEFRGSIDGAVQAINDIGVRASRGHYSAWSRTEWKVCPDGSVPNGGELKSRTLDFDSAEDRAEFTNVLQALQGIGCRPISEAGIHINVDAANLTPDELSAVLRSYVRYEDILWRIASSGWRTVRPRALTQYAMNVPESAVKKLIPKKELEAFKQTYYRVGGRKYHAISLDKWFRCGALEFRMFNASMNPKRVLAYAALCMAIVQDARNGYRRALGKSVKLGDFASGRRDADREYKWMRHVLKGVAGLTEDDAKLLDMCWRDSRNQERPTSYYRV